MKVKICGLKTLEHVEVAVAYGADYLGFVFAESKRQVSPKQVKTITKNVPKNIKKVGVFVAPSVEEVEAIIRQAGLDIVQIHGVQTLENYSVPMIQAVTVTKRKMQLLQAQYVLFDAPPKTYVGGNGQTFDWHQLDRQLIHTKKCFIAGGLNKSNVQQAKAFFQPYAVDVSSGVESNGEKDRHKIIEFLKKAKEELDV